jgi:CheY-like chemotaxis protein
MTRILIIDDEQSVREVLKIALSEKGYEILEAADGREGVKQFQSATPDVVITDVMMPEMDGIEVMRRIRETSESADIIIMTGYGSEELVIEALRYGASNYLKKPIDFEDLFAVIDKINFRRQHRKRFEVAKDVVHFEKKDLVLGNSLTDVWGAVNQVLYNVGGYLQGRVLDGMRIGLYEIIVNAIEHGNLGISSKDKSDAILGKRYSDLLSDKAKEADAEGKRVHISSSYTRKKLTVEVRDEGTGFRFRELPDMSDPNTIMSVNGRGIFLTSLYFDKVEFREPGNTVFLEKAL